MIKAAGGRPPTAGPPGPADGRATTLPPPVSLLAATRRRRVLLRMTISGALTLAGAGIGMRWLQASLIARAGPAYQSAVGVIVHSVTSGFFTMAGWLLACCIVVAAAALASGLRWRAVTGARGRRGTGSGEREPAASGRG